MERSEQIDQLAAALAKFQGELEQPKLNSVVKVKTRGGYEYSFKYADLAECKNAAKKPLAANQLAVTQLIEEDGSIVTMLLHASGQWISSRTKMPVTEPGAQAMGSAITYAKRYAFCAMLGIVADDDEDGNLSQGNVASKGNAPAGGQPAPKPGKEMGRRMFDLKMLDRPDFFPGIHRYETEAKAKGQPFSIRAFLDGIYRIDENAMRQIEDRYTEYKINNNLS